jgi:Mechanosensitive ion channel
VLALLSHRDANLFWGAAAIAVAILLRRILTLIVGRLSDRRPVEERQLARLRRNETLIVLIATAIPYATAIVVVIVVASAFLPKTATALGGSALVGVLIGFAAQRFLMDVIAGALIALEQWYGVGDFVTLEPAKASGVVEEFGLRSTVVRALNGDRAYVPNSQIIAATRSPRGYRTYSIELLTSDPEDAKRAIESAGRRAPSGEARFLRPPRVVDVRELGEGAWLVRGRADVAPTMEWLAEDLLVGVLKSQLPSESLLAAPIVYTIDEGALSRYERRLLLR